MEMNRQVLEELLSIARDPYPKLLDWKRGKGIKVIGSTLADVPEELIHAAGMLPITILGTNKPILRANTHLPDNACSQARSDLELVLTYQGDVFDGYVLPQVDDTTQHLSDIWRRNVPWDYFESYLLPRQIDRPSAREWLRQETLRLKGSLEMFVGEEITGEKLWSSIDLYNQSRGYLRRLYELKKRHPRFISNRELYDLIKSSMWWPKEEHNRIVESFISGIEHTDLPTQTDEDIRVVLSGIVWEPPEIMDILDESGLEVVGDDLCVGWRYIATDIHMDGDPVETLVDRHFRKGPFTPIYDKGNRIFENLFNLVTENGARAVIYLHIKFNESQDFDLPDLVHTMEGEGIPILVVETEYQTTHLAGTRTRIQAFKEALVGR
jgi:benzoyl-CoA reductase/2-hydroxyglutaryl-CoA dehydratase subunit BcrC/BadD/HgdB